jgi:hypothetical protein
MFRGNHKAEELEKTVRNKNVLFSRKLSLIWQKITPLDRQMQSMFLDASWLFWKTVSVKRLKEE